MRSFEFAGQEKLEDAPSGWIKKAASITETKGVTARAKNIMARLTFDSWAVPQPIGVRDQSHISDRRIRFQAEDIVLDFRAERQSTGWAFVAQVTAEKAADAILELGKKRVRADTTGLFQWTSRRPLTGLIVRCGDVTITLPELSWKDPQQS
jgi:hypothetical protein